MSDLLIDVEVRSLEVRKQITKKDNTLFWQKVGYQNGDDFPIVFDLFRDGGDPLPLGRHKVLLALRANQWGALEVDTFRCKALPGKP